MIILLQPLTAKNEISSADLSGGVSTKKPFIAAQQWAFFMHLSLDSTASEPRLAPLISEGGVSTKKPFVAAQQWAFFMHLSLDSTASNQIRGA
jgi:hypothetical protein